MLDRRCWSGPRRRSLGYGRHRDKLLQQIAAADWQIKEAAVIDLNLEGVLAFAEGLLVNAAQV